MFALYLSSKKLFQLLSGCNVSMHWDEEAE